jgi:serine/threonine protein kinase
VELIDGKTLTELLNQRDSLSLSDVKNMIYQLCIGLDLLHKNGILHRDVKPDNIMVKENLNVVLIDYDITRMYDKDKASDTILSGTRGYAAPEQFGFSQTTIKSDIYSLGVTIGELLLKLSPDNRILLDHIYKKAVMLDPVKRYDSVEEIINIISNNETEFFDVQIEQIDKGKKLGLSEQQILIYAKPYFNSTQMGVIKHALNEGVSKKVIAIIADPAFNSKQMWQIKRGFLDGLSTSDILKYSKPMYLEVEMSLYRTGLVLGCFEEVIFKNIKFYSELLRSCTFNSEQLIVIRTGFYRGLDYDSIRPICFSDLDVEKMKEILDILVS